MSDNIPSDRFAFIRRRGTIVLALALAIGAGGIFWLTSTPSQVSTDNA